MAYLLDTNIVSELVRPAPDGKVVAWVESCSPLELYLSVLTFGEISRGVARLATGARRSRLTRWLERELPRQFLGRLLAIDDAVAVRWGQLAASGDAAGRPLPVIDGLLLATADVHGLVLVTRNASDCAGRGVPVFDPWNGTEHNQ